MKKALLIALFLVFPITASAGIVGEEERKFEAKEFETVITITYNAITLEQAEKLEAYVKHKFNDACKVDLKLDDVQSLTDGFVTGFYITRDDEN